MTDQELKDLVAGLAVISANTSREIDRMSQEVRQIQAETSREIKQIQAETAREIKQVQAETAKEIKQVQAQTAREIKQVNKQVGEMGNRWGSYTEDLAFPSLVSILETRFQMDTIVQRARKRIGGRHIEIDVLAYANSTLNTAFVVEVKSNLQDENISELLETIANFYAYFPEHKDKKIFGMIACVSAADSAINLARKRGIYVVRVSDGIFKSVENDKFIATDFSKTTKIQE